MYISINEEFGSYIVFNENEKEDVTNIFEKMQQIEKEAENKPKGWISNKILQFRQLYKNYLNKLDKEKDQEKINIFKKILRCILHLIDSLVKKMQHKFDKRTKEEYEKDLNDISGGKYKEYRAKGNEFIKKHWNDMRKYAEHMGEDIDKKKGKIF